LLLLLLLLVPYLPCSFIHYGHSKFILSYDGPLLLLLLLSLSMLLGTHWALSAESLLSAAACCCCRRYHHLAACSYSMGSVKASTACPTWPE
jgi:hypothetical protein